MVGGDFPPLETVEKVFSFKNIIIKERERML